MSEEMKTSKYKPTFDIRSIESFVQVNFDGVGGIEKLTEGHISQVYSFTIKDGSKRVIRISTDEDGFNKDQFAYKNYSSTTLPIPKVFEIGKFGNSHHYCVSEFINGTPSDQLTDEEMRSCLDEQLNCFAQIYEIDCEYGEGSNAEWMKSLNADIENLDHELLKSGLHNIGLETDLFDKFNNQFKENSDQLGDSVSSLIHGDLGFDNVLINDNKVVAVIDWADLGHGDWLYEFVKFEFWWPGRYGDAREFGTKYNLDLSHFDQRFKAYTSHIALTTIDWALENESQSTLDFLKMYLGSRI